MRFFLSFFVCFFCFVQSTKACDEAEIHRILPIGFFNQKLFFLKIVLHRGSQNGSFSLQKNSVLEQKIPPTKERVVFGPGGFWVWKGEMTLLSFDKTGRLERYLFSKKRLAAYACAAKDCIASIRKTFWEKLIRIGKEQLRKISRKKYSLLRIHKFDCGRSKKCGAFRVMPGSFEKMPNSDQKMPTSNLWYRKGRRKKIYKIPHRFGSEGAPSDYVFYVRKLFVWKKVVYLITLDSVLVDVGSERYAGKTKRGREKKCSSCFPVHPAEYHGYYGDFFFSEKWGLLWP